MFLEAVYDEMKPYCQHVVAPKVAKFRKHCLDRLKRKA